MNFIFPQNYSFRVRLFGIFDYSTIIFNLIFGLIIFLITKLFNFNIFFKILFFIITYFPIFLISIFGVRQENVIYIFYYLYNYLKNNKLYLYK